MKVLVTGATGFVGACLTRRLLKLGHEVHLFVRTESNRWRLAGLLGDVVQHAVDLRDPQAVSGAVAAIKAQGIFHLATYGGFSFQRDAGTIFAANLGGTMNLVGACQKVGFDFFVNTGSSSEYGIKSLPMKESDLLEPLGDYAVSKAAATLYCRSEALRKDQPMVTLRVFSPYGPWDDPKRLIPYVMSSLLRQTAPVLSSPCAVRDYLYIGDAIDAYLAVTGATIVPGAIYNVGSGRQSDVGTVVAKIAAQIGSQAVPVWGARELAHSEPAAWVADVTALQSQVSWRPAVALDDGLQKTIDWMQGNLAYYHN